MKIDPEAETGRAGWTYPEDFQREEEPERRWPSGWWLIPGALLGCLFYASIAIWFVSGGSQ